MTIISSFRLKIYFKGNFQLSVFVLTIFHQNLLMELYDTEYISNERDSTTNSEPSKKVDISKFPIVLNEDSVAVN